MCCCLCPAGRAGLGAALVVAIAAIDRLTTHRCERNLGSNTTTVAGDANHRSLAGSTVAFAGGLPFVAAVLAALRFVCETTFCVECLFIFAEYEFLSAVSTVERFVIKRVHEAMIS
jgi:hypothetical protein